MPAITIRRMTPADIHLGLRLTAQAHWNQLPGDWQRMLEMQPEGCFVAEYDGVAVGTTVACLFDNVAWIAMVLVDTSVRGRGVGRALVTHALEYIDGQGVPTVRLDATSLGQPLYESFGFRPQYTLDRYAGRLPSSPVSASAVSIRQATTHDYAQLIERDKHVTGANRSKLLLRLFHGHPLNTCVAERDGQLTGFAATRPGRNAWQVGPCIAEPAAGEALLQHALRNLAGESVFLDLPTANLAAVQLAQSAGLTVQRSFVRMCRGVQVEDDLTQLWSSSGPELG